MADIKHTGGSSTAAIGGRLTFEQDKNRIIGRDKNTTPRMVISAEGDEFLMMISKLGINVLEGDDNDMVFNSSNNLFKIVGSGTVTLTIPTIANGTSQTATATATHDLGRTPIVIAFASRPNPQQPRTDLHTFGQSIVQARNITTSGMTLAYLSSERLESSETSIWFEWTVSNSTGLAQPGGTETVKYYLLSETAVS